MRNIEVAADDDGLLRAQVKQERAERILPDHAVVETQEPVLRVRCVDGDEVDILELHRDDAPLVVVLLYADAIADRERL